MTMEEEIYVFLRNLLAPSCCKKLFEMTVEDWKAENHAAEELPATAGLDLRANCCAQCAERCKRDQHGTAWAGHIKTPLQGPPRPARHPCFLKTDLERSLQRSWLRIPKTFVDHHGKGLCGNTVDLEVIRGAIGKVWLVDVHTMSPDVVGFNYGWSVFATDNNLRVGDCLLFTLVAKLRFSVLIFNRLGLELTRLLPNEAAHTRATTSSDPARDSIGDASNNMWVINEHISESTENMHISDQGSLWIRREATDASERESPSLQHILSEIGLQKRQPTSKTLNHFHSNQRRWHSRVTYNKKQGCVQVEPGWMSKKIESRRRPVTDAEREKAMADALNFATIRPSVVVLMKPSHVYHGFWLTIPSDYARAYMPQNRATITLQDVHKFEWHANWIVTEHHTGVSGGWAAFSRDHCLEEGDGCRFEVINSTEMSCVVLVHIFRVVDVDLVPGTRGGWDVMYNVVKGQSIYQSGHQDIHLAGGGVALAKEDEGSRLMNQTNINSNSKKRKTKRKKNLAAVLYDRLFNGQFAKRQRQLQMLHTSKGFTPGDEELEDVKPQVDGPTSPSTPHTKLHADGNCKPIKIDYQNFQDVKPAADELQAPLKLSPLLTPVDDIEQSTSLVVQSSPLHTSVQVKPEPLDINNFPKDFEPTLEQVKTSLDQLSGGSADHIDSIQKFQSLEDSEPAEVVMLPGTEKSVGMDQVEDATSDQGRSWYEVIRFLDKRRREDKAEHEFLVEINESVTNQQIISSNTSVEQYENGLWWIPWSHFTIDLSRCYID